ncbi:MAG: DNA polymerase III subunit gamma/tau [Prochlorococcus sp.]
MSQAYQPLHHKYRPQRFDQLVGQEAIAATLSHALLSKRIAPAYLFSGPRGTGKTSSARILARSLNCIGSEEPTPEPCGACELCTTIAAGTALDVIEIDAASNTGVDNIRELIERSRFAPVQARWKVYVIDECHMLSTAAFNALLKTLEEPPPRVVFVLATTDPQRVLPTILSRCQRFDFRRIPLQALEGHLSWIAEQEQIQIKPEALHVVAQRAQGGLRDAESLLDQLSLLPPPIEANAVWELLGAVPEQELLQLATALAESEPLPLLEACRTLMDRGREPGAVLQGLAAVLRDLVLMAAAPQRLELTSLSPQFREQLPQLAKTVGRARLLHWQAQLKGSEYQLRQSVQPRLWLEVLLLGLLAEPLAAAAPAPAAAAARAPVPTATQVPTTALPTTTASAPEATATPLSQAPPRQPAAPAPVAVPSTAAVPEPTVVAASTAVTASTATTAPEPQLPEVAPPAAVSTNLPELWQQILGSLELPSTRMLLSQQAQLVRLDNSRAVVQVAGNWMGMVQSRASLLEQAIATALGGPRQLILEGQSAGYMQMQPAAAQTPPITPQPAQQQPAPTQQPPTQQPPPPQLPSQQATAQPLPTAQPQQPAQPLPTGAAPAPVATAASSQPMPQAQAAQPAAAPLAATTPTTPQTQPAATTQPAVPAQPAVAAQQATANATAKPAPQSPQVAAPPTGIDKQAKQLADFFNGQVLDVDPDGIN